MKSAFTLIELLVVIAIIAVLAAILFPVFARAKAAAKASVCLSNVREIGMATLMYLGDSDDTYPQTKDSSSSPATDDANGSMAVPDYGSPFDLIAPYAASRTGKNASKLFVCPESYDPYGQNCVAINPDVPSLNSYLTNAYFIFGLSQSSIPAPASLIEYSERRTKPTDVEPPYCDYAYYPWFSTLNPSAPENDMDAANGAVATAIHNGLATYAFADGHVKRMPWGQTYAPPTIDLHQPDAQP